MGHQNQSKRILIIQKNHVKFPNVPFSRKNAIPFTRPKHEWIVSRREWGGGEERPPRNRPRKLNETYRGHTHSSPRSSLSMCGSSSRRIAIATFAFAFTPWLGVFIFILINVVGILRGRNESASVLVKLRTCSYRLRNFLVVSVARYLGQLWF